MTSHDPRRCCEAVRSAILATAWLLVNIQSTLAVENILNTAFKQGTNVEHLSRHN